LGDTKDIVIPCPKVGGEIPPVPMKLGTWSWQQHKNTSIQRQAFGLIEKRYNLDI